MSFAGRIENSRNPNEIATEILAAKGVKSNGEKTETFEEIVEEIANPTYASDTIGVDENSDPKDPLVAEALESQNFAHLLAALCAARDGTELTKEQKASLRTSAHLISLLIASAQRIGGEGYDDSQRLSNQSKNFYKNIVNALGKDKELPPELAESIRSEYEKQAQYHAALTRMYQSTIPLLKELAKALYIQFDNPRDGIA